MRRFAGAAVMMPSKGLVVLTVTLAVCALRPGFSGIAADQRTPERDQPARQGTASVRGVVVDGATGAPLRRAAVSLLMQYPDREGARVVATTADTNGQFVFAGVPPGRVQVTASRAGYFDYNNVWNGEPQEPEWQDIGPGERVQGVRIALYRGGVIAGRIVDEFGEPAAGVEIEVLRRDPGERGMTVRTTSMFLTPTTDDTGAFRVWGLAPGDYLVGARPNRFIASTPDDGESQREGYAATYYPGTPSLSAARLVRVTPGRDTTGVAFGLMRVPLAAVRGMVLLPDGVSGRSVNVGLALIAPERVDGFVTRGTRARDDGSFELSGLAPGAYSVTARYQQTQGDVEFYGATTVEVAGGDVDGVAIPLRAGATVRGRVRDEEGRPLSVPVMVSLVNTASGRAPSPRPARTYSDGSFRLDGAFGRQVVRAVEARIAPGAEDPGLVSRGLQEVTPASRALTTWWVKSIAVNGRNVVDETVEFDQGELDLEITMTNRGSSVRGLVSWNRTRSGRRPAVVVFVDDDARWEPPTRRVGTSEVEPDGRFDVRGLPPGDRYLAVAVEGAARAVLSRPDVLTAIRPFATPLRIDEGGIHDLNLTAIPRPRP
jgi:protocatechuate 3,4-dioxygenase beta subunit